MSAVVTLICDCSDSCVDTLLVDGVQDLIQARVRAHRSGWDADTLPGGDTVDLAPGHTLRRQS